MLGYTPGAAWRDELAWGTKLNGAKVAAALAPPTAGSTGKGSGGGESLSERP